MLHKLISESEGVVEWVRIRAQFSEEITIMASSRVLLHLLLLRTSKWIFVLIDPFGIDDDFEGLEPLPFGTCHRSDRINKWAIGFSSKFMGPNHNN